MAAPFVPPVGTDAYIIYWCNRALDHCHRRLLTEQGFKRSAAAACINEQKTAVKSRFANYQRVYGINANKLIDEFDWSIPAHWEIFEGGKRKRRTRHRKRFHKKIEPEDIAECANNDGSHYKYF